MDKKKRSFDIKKANEADIAAVAAIYEHILDGEDTNHPKIGWIRGVYPVESTAQAALERGELFVCEENGQIVASAIINKTQVDVYADCKWSRDCEASEVMVLHTLTVEPSCAGRGIGRRFVAFYEEMARADGCKALRMDTNAVNTAARTLYKKLGYTEVGVVPCVFNSIPDVKLVCLEKLL